MKQRITFTKSALACTHDVWTHAHTCRLCSHGGSLAARWGSLKLAARWGRAARWGNLKLAARWWCLTASKTSSTHCPTSAIATATGHCTNANTSSPTLSPSSPTLNPGIYPILVCHNRVPVLLSTAAVSVAPQPAQAAGPASPQPAQAGGPTSNSPQPAQAEVVGAAVAQQEKAARPCRVVVVEVSNPTCTS